MCEKCDFRNEAKSYELGNSITGISWYFDVTMAEEFIQKYSIPPMRVPKDLLEHTIQVNDVDLSHIDHVDMSKPLIFGILPSNPTPPAAVMVVIPGKETVYFAPLDGSHRAARAVRDGIEVQAYYLTQEMTMACMVAYENKYTGEFKIKPEALAKSIKLAMEAGLL